MKQTSEAAFETAIEAVLLADGYTKLPSDGFDPERAIFPAESLTFIRETQAKTWEKLEALHGDETGERVLQALCKHPWNLDHPAPRLQVLWQNTAYRFLPPRPRPKPRVGGALSCKQDGHYPSALLQRKK